MGRAPSCIPPERRSPRGNPAGPLRTALCASGEGGGSVLGAICSAIDLDGGTAPEWVQLFPPGPHLEAIAGDGRRWMLSNPARVAAVSMEGGLDLPVDWEHGQHRKAPKGERADAAGWIKEIALRDGSLFGRVEWTAEGRASVESGAYRYLSPAFDYNRETLEVIRVNGAGLVNRPAFVMPALAGQEESTMIKKILAALGLAADASEEKALEAIASLKSERDTAVAQAAAPPLDRFVPRSDYDSAVAARATAESELAAERSSQRNDEIKQLLDEAQAAGKITPATRDYHAAQCRAEGGIDRFRDFVAKTPEIAGAGGGSGAPPAGAGLIVLGCFEEGVSNAGSMAGDVSVLVRRKGAFLWNNSAGTDAVTAARIGSPCYVVDDETVAASDGGHARSPAGIVVAVGHDGVWVDVEGPPRGPRVLSASADLDFADMAGGAHSHKDIDLPGASVGDLVALGLPAAPDGGLVYYAHVPEAGKVRIRAANTTDAAIDPVAAAFTVAVIKG